MNGFKKFLQLNTIEKNLFFQATVTSILVKMMVTIFPLRWYAKVLGIEHAVTSEEPTNVNHIIYKVSRATARSKKVLPWKSTCLVNAITAKILLKRQGINSTLYLGLNKENGAMSAHAWLRCGTIYVTGKREMGKFVVVSTFS